MRKSTKLIKRFLALFLVVLMSIDSIAATVSDNDGAAFITKAEFDSLRSEFQQQLEAQNSNIDNKINSVINSYLSGVNLSSERVLESLLNKLSTNRRTFVNNIKNPSTSKQENLYISTNGFWTANWSQSNRNGSIPTGYNEEDVYWYGWLFNGLNNFDEEPGLGRHHIRGPWEKNNLTAGDGKGNGKYVFVDNIKTDDPNGYYIEDEYVKDLKFRIWSIGSDETYPTPQCDPSSPACYDTPNIHWDNIHYNWTGTNRRQVATYKSVGGGTTLPVMVEAAETLYLGIDNYDYDTNTTVLDKIPWVNNMASGAVYTEKTGCLINKDQYNWSYYMSDFSLGVQGGQCYGSGYTKNTEPYNRVKYGKNVHTESNQTGLYFYVPKITELGCDKLGSKDATDVAGVITYYHSGLPLVKIDKPGALKIKLNVARKNSNKSVTIAIKKKQFGNMALAGESGDDLLFRKTYTPSDLSTGSVEIQIAEDKLKGVFDTLLWIKAYEDSDSDGYVTIGTSEIKIKQ